MTARATLGLGAVAIAAIAAIALSRGGSPATPRAAAAPTDARGVPGPAAAPAARSTAASGAPAPVAALAPVAAPVAAPGYTFDDLALAKADPGDDGTARLIDGLAAADDVLVAEAADGLVARRATGAIAALAAVDIDARPGVTPAVVDGLGRLGGIADDGSAARDAAVTRLVALLHAEKQRPGGAIEATLLYLYEALGQTRDPRAAAALVPELADPRVGTAPKVVVVEALARLGATSSRPALTALRERTVGAPSADRFEAELQHDLIAAIDQALLALR